MKDEADPGLREDMAGILDEILFLILGNMQFLRKQACQLLGRFPFAGFDLPYGCF